MQGQIDMTQTSSAERRAHPRRDVWAAVRFYHPSSGRQLPARSLNVSRGGMWMHVPADAPLREGETIRLEELPGPQGGRYTPAEGQPPLEATVLRVDRRELLTSGRVAVGVQFARLLA